MRGFAGGHFAVAGQAAQVGKLIQLPELREYFS
jgi:hypothetical protein